MNASPRYRNDPQAIASLVEPDQVHRDVYTDPEVFELEMERLWRRAWVYVGHESQVPKAGDYLSADIGNQPVLLVRQKDGSVRVLHNRCAHKGAKLVTSPTGSTGSQFRCPYHAWIYKTDGTLAGVPLKSGYDDTAFVQAPAQGGMCRVKNVASHRGFVFARLSDSGPDFEDYFGDSLSSIDNMADRSPEGELEAVGGCLRYEHNCNWKMFIENLNDTMHPMVAHESSAGTAKDLWKDEPADKPKPMAVEVMLPFTENYQFSDAMGVRVFEGGHSYTGTAELSLHSRYSQVPGYEDQLVARHGEQRAKEILATTRHNTVYYPSLTVKGAIQAIRVIRPIAVDRTVVESWTFRLKGAPDALLQRTMMYSRLINSPMSVVGHDDLHCYRSIQEGLVSEPNPWVSLHRNHRAGEAAERDQTVNGTSEISMRNQFRRVVLNDGGDPTMNTTVQPTRDDLVAFVLNEARLLDEKRYEDWYALFTEDARYWIPLQHGQEDPLSHNSLMYEDRLLLRLRIDRLSHARAFSQQPASRCQHVLQTPSVERLDVAANQYLVRTPFAYFEARGEEQLVLAGVAWHSLVSSDDGQLRLQQKRVNLLNCDAALPSIQLFL